MKNKQVIINSLPEGKLTESNYRLVESEIPEISSDQVLVKTISFAITAGTRAGLQGSASYAGMILGSALFRLNSGGRIACCGVVSQYDTSTPEPGPRGIPGLLVNKSIRMQGFLVFDFADKYEEATNDLIGWIDSGQLKVLTDELEGLEKSPQGFVDLLAGGNIGTRIVNI